MGSDWIHRKLRLKANMIKTHITRPSKLKYFRFGFYEDSKTKEGKSRPHQNSVKKLKDRLKERANKKMPETVGSAEETLMETEETGERKRPARLTAYCGDHYYWIDTKTCIGRVISKEVLRRAGPVSCFDYYNEHYALKLC